MESIEHDIDVHSKNDNINELNSAIEPNENNMLQYKKSKKHAVQKSSIIFNLLYSIVPLIGFWWIEEKYGLVAGIIAAIVLALLEVIWTLIKERRFEPFSTWSAVLIIVMGVISWKLNNDVFIKLKPAILESVFVGLFFISSLIHKPFLLLVAKKQLGNSLGDYQTSYLAKLNWHIGMLFLVHVLIIVYSAFWLSHNQWMFVTSVLFYIMFAVFFLIEFVVSRIRFFRYRKQLQSQQIFLQYQRDIIQQMKYSNREQQSSNKEN